MSSHETPEKLISWLEQYWFSEDLSVIPAEAGIQSNNLKAYVDASLRWHDKRVAKLLPKSPSEITDRFNPLEIGLRELIDENKGCYIGQEVIARLLTYSKVTKILVSLGCKREDFENLCKAPEVTSSLDKYVEGEPVALAVIKKTALTTESFFTTSGVPAWVVSSAR
ncbi:MAG: hypothetical protein JKY15_08670 [Deltaproteobacteria bacterium]|nr:hypothetical protein [Deltaproteobacteria bacterium]